MFLHPGEGRRIRPLPPECFLSVLQCFLAFLYQAQPVCYSRVLFLPAAEREAKDTVDTSRGLAQHKLLQNPCGPREGKTVHPADCHICILHTCAIYSEATVNQSKTPGTRTTPFPYRQLQVSLLPVDFNPSVPVRPAPVHAPYVSALEEFCEIISKAGPVQVHAHKYATDYVEELRLGPVNIQSCAL